MYRIKIYSPDVIHKTHNWYYVSKKLRLPNIHCLISAFVATLLAIFCHPNSILVVIAKSFLCPLGTLCVLVVTITNEAASRAINLHPRWVFVAFPYGRPSFAICSVVNILAGANSTAFLAVFSHPLRLLLALAKVGPKLAVSWGSILTI